jgi:hypothetical protein
MIISRPLTTCIETTSFLANELLLIALIICGQPIFFQEMTWTHNMKNAPIINICVIGDRQQKGKTIITSQFV